MSRMSFSVDMDVIIASSIKDIKVNQKYMSQLFLNRFC